MSPGIASLALLAAAWMAAPAWGQIVEDIDFTGESPRLEAADTTPDDLLRYARLAQTDAESLELTGATDEAVAAMWAQVAAAFVRFVDAAPVHRGAREARLLAAEAYARAGRPLEAVRFCIGWSARVNTASERLDLARLSLQLAQKANRASVSGAGEAVLAALEVYGTVDPAAGEPDECALHVHEAAERHARAGNAERAAELYRTVLRCRPSAQVAESAAAGLLHPLRERGAWQELIALARDLESSELATRADTKAFRALMKDQISGAELEKARAAQQTEHWDEMASALARAGSGSGGEAEVAYQRAWAAAQKDSLAGEGALVSFAKAFERDARAPQAMLVAATRADQRGDVDAAAERYEAVVERWPAQPRGWEAARRLGELRALDNRMLDAAKAFELAATSAPADERLHLEHRCADAWDKAGQDAKALRWYDALLARHAGSTSTLTPAMWVELAVRAGLVAERAHKLARAKSYFELAARIATTEGVQGAWVERARSRLDQ